MSHLIETMAYTGQTPWHNLGNELPAKQPMDVWARAAGMDWSIHETPVRYMTSPSDNGSNRTSSVSDFYGEPMEFPDQKVLYRSDTKAPLSVVSSRYQVVQPKEVLEFYRDLTEVSGYELETAGVLKAGRKFWALATYWQVFGSEGHGCGQWLSAVGHFLRWDVGHHSDTDHCPRGVQQHPVHCPVWCVQCHPSPHSTSFNAQAVNKQLGIAVTQWDGFMYRMKTLSERKVKSHESMNYFLKVLCQTDGHADAAAGLVNEWALKKVQAMYEGQGRGAELAAAKGTAWGLLCAVTEFVNHERRARSQEYRLDSAWFGQGAALKQRALEHALQLVS